MWLCKRGYLGSFLFLLPMSFLSCVSIQILVCLNTGWSKQLVFDWIIIYNLLFGNANYIWWDLNFGVIMKCLWKTAKGSCFASLNGMFLLLLNRQKRSRNIMLVVIRLFFGTISLKNNTSLLNWVFDRKKSSFLPFP